MPNRHNLPAQGAIKTELLRLIVVRARHEITPSVAYEELAQSFHLTAEQMDRTYATGENVWKAFVRAAKHALMLSGDIIAPQRGKWMLTRE